jgi:DNA-binding MarR family transcriptional regulator
MSKAVKRTAAPKKRRRKMTTEGIFIAGASKSYPIEHSIGGTMTQIMRFLNPCLDHLMQDYGVSHGTWFYVRTLWDEDGISQRELADRVGTSAPTTLAALRNLDAQGYVKLGFDQKDKRRSVVRLTARGRALQDDLIPLAAEINPKVLKGLSNEEARELIRMLQVIKRNASEAYAEVRRIQAEENAA